MEDRHGTATDVVVHVDQIGGLGNRMFQHMAALFLLSRIASSRLSGIDLPEWGLTQPDIRDGSETVFTVKRDTHMRIPLERILQGVRAGRYDCVNVRNYAQHMDNLLPVEMYRDVYVDRMSGQAAIGHDEILINVRGGDILSGAAPDYVLLPAGYLRQVVAETGLRPVLMGQLDPGPYLDELRSALPEARLIPSRGVMQDFSIIRSAKHIAISISTFSWLAAWLSHADRIFCPIAGAFSPFQRSDIDLLPLDDPRYRFDLFPAYFAMDPVAAVEQHRSIEGLWRRMSGRQIRAMTAAGHRFAFDVTRIQPFFDEAYYCAAHGDVGGAKHGGTVPSGFEHYLRVGHKEGRAPFRLDRAWYCKAYPMAALELGQGDYRDCHHHYAEVGAARGYRTDAPDNRGEAIDVAALIGRDADAERRTLRLVSSSRGSVQAAEDGGLVHSPRKISNGKREIVAFVPPGQLGHAFLCLREPSSERLFVKHDSDAAPVLSYLIDQSPGGGRIALRNPVTGKVLSAADVPLRQTELVCDRTGINHWELFSLHRWGKGMTDEPPDCLLAIVRLYRAGLSAQSVPEWLSEESDETLAMCGAAVLRILPRAVRDTVIDGLRRDPAMARRFAGSPTGPEWLAGILQDVKT